MSPHCHSNRISTASGQCGVSSHAGQICPRGNWSGSLTQLAGSEPEAERARQAIVPPHWGSGGTREATKLTDADHASKG